MSIHPPENPGAIPVDDNASCGGCAAQSSGKKTTRLCLLGAESAGKTCFIAGLGILGEPQRQSDFHVLGRNEDSQKYLNELVNALHARIWPPGTTQTRFVELDVRYKDSILQLSLLDYRGEEFRRAFCDLDKSRLEQLWAHLEGVRFLLLVLDPDLDLQRGGDDSHQEDRRRRERLNALLQALFQVCHAQIEAGKRTRPPEVAVLLCKRDRHPELGGEISARTFLKTRAPQLYRRLLDWSPRLGVYSVSAVGAVASDARIPGGGNTLPARELCPTGYQEVFDWILWRKGAGARTLGYGLAGAAMAIMMLIAVAWWAQLAWNQSRLHDNAQASALAAVDGAVWLPTHGYKARLDALVGAEFHRLEQRLNGEPGLLEMKEIIAAASCLSRCRNSQFQLQATEFLRQAQQLRRGALLILVRSLYDQRNAGFPEAASAFLVEFPQGQDADGVRDMQKNRRVQERQRQRAMVRAVRPEELHFLARKADAIAVYVAEFAAEDPSVSEMRRAEKLARRLAGTATYMIRLRACGIFADPQRHGIRILRKDNEVRFISGGTSTSNNWGPEEASFLFPWEPGDAIAVELWNYRWYWKNQVAAYAFAEGPLSLGIFCGKHKLEYGDGWNSADFSDGPYIKFEIEGLVEDDFRILNNWVWPGDQW